MDVRKAAEFGANVCPVGEVRDQQLLLAGFCCTPTGLLPNEGLTERQWEEAGRTLGHVDQRLMWYVGDWLRAGEDNGYIERGKLAEACERFGISYSTAANAASICKAIDQSSRRRELSFSHHAEVANRDDADDLLDWCEENNASREELRREKRQRDEAIEVELPDEPGKYRVIYADPPWKYGDERGTVAAGGAVAQYPLMSIESLCKMDVALLAAKDAVLFMWVTVPLADEALEVVDAWGFEYKTQLVWDKQRPFYGNYSHVQHELLYICTKGSCTPAKGVDLPHSIVSIKRTKHSAKPHEFYDLIETLYPRGKKIELFARNEREGWDCWGNEVS